MATRIALLRGINVGSANRIAMQDLRGALAAAGFANVRTYLQSGNVVLDGDGDVEAAIRAVIDVPVVTRTAEELDAVIAANPITPVEDPKLLQVTFCSGAPDLDGLRARASGSERVEAVGNQIYSWHPDGIARSKLALALTKPGQAATARNWNTVLALQELTHG